MQKTIKRLKNELRNKNITVQQYRTMKGQCLAGDVEGALRGLRKLIK